MGLREDAPDNTANESILVGEKVGKKKSSLSLALNGNHKNLKNLKQIIILSFDAIKERRLRSTLTVLMVVAGCALIVALNAMSAGNIAFISKQLDSLAPNIIWILQKSP